MNLPQSLGPNKLNFGLPMENLPDAMMSEILRRIDRTADRNALSMVSSRLCSIEARHRDFLRVGCGLHPANDALTSLCIRFPNLTRLEIVYSGWMSSMGKQLDNQGLLVLSSRCHNLVELTLSFCSFVGDTGIAYLALCKGLKALTLNFLPGVSSNGLLSVVIGCKELSSFHLTRCVNVRSVGWLEYLGKHGNLETLSINNCRGVGQDELMKLGPGWKKLQHLELEIDTNYKYNYDQAPVSTWEICCCDSLRKLVLVNCSFHTGSYLAYVLGKCKALEDLSLHSCSGLQDRDMSVLSQKSCGLRRISLSLSTEYLTPYRMSDDGLKELARGCPMLEELELFFPDWVSLYGFSINSVLSLIKSCPIRVLVLSNAWFLNDAGMSALCSAPFLQVLELIKCQDVTDKGLELVANYPSLKRLKLEKCLRVGNHGLKPLVGSGELDYLAIEDCPFIAEIGVQGAARHVSYKQDLSWVY